MGPSTLISVLMFIKELIFGKNNSNNNKTFSSKVRNWVIFLILATSLGANYFLGNKVVRLTIAYINLDKEKKKLQEKIKANVQCHIANDAIEKLFLKCRGKL